MTTALLQTKLFIPPLRPEHVPRPRLIRHLDEGLSKSRVFTLISAPADWESAAPGTFVRGQNALDPTALIVEVLPIGREDFLSLITAQLGLDEAPEGSGERVTDSFTWTLYAVEVQGLGIDIATTMPEDESTLMVLLQGDPDEREWLYETVFLPAVDALAALE